MAKILLLGKDGQVGWELHRALHTLGDVAALDAPMLDFTDLDLLRHQVTSVGADIIVNAVAYTNVDRAEAQPDLVMTINAHAPKLLAELACQMKAVLVHYSTDYVFDGTKPAPYTEKDLPGPLNVYAVSKWEGDRAVESAEGAYFILRSSWVYSGRRDNFVKKVLQWAHLQKELRIVSDQVSCPTWARSLAEATGQILSQGKKQPWDWAKEFRGTYHLASAGYASRFEWAEEILRLDPDRTTQTITSVIPSKTEDFPTPARRPLFTPLNSMLAADTFGVALPDWRASLELAFQTDFIAAHNPE